MAGISPQGVAVTGGGIRRKIRSPYVDMIRGQHGQATQNVLQQRQEDQTQAQVDQQNKYQQQNLALAAQNQKFQKEQAKQAGKMNMISTGINAVGTLGNLYNQTGGFGGLGSAIGTGAKKLFSNDGIFGGLMGMFK